MNDMRAVRLEWWAMGAAILMTLARALMVILPPLVGERSEFLLLLVSLLVVPLFFGGAACFVLALAYRRPWLLMSCVAVLSAVNIRIVSDPQIERKLWSTRFEKHGPALEKALAWAREQPVPPEGATLKLPPSLAHLAERGTAIAHREEDGTLWIAFPVFTHGIDNSVGFIWSEARRTPPRLAFPELVSAAPLRDGWQLFWST